MQLPLLRRLLSRVFLSVLIVRLRGVILRKGQVKGCRFPGPESGTWVTRLRCSHGKFDGSLR